MISNEAISDDNKAALMTAVRALERHDPLNGYDRNDVVKRGACIVAGPLRVAEYKVRDPETQEWSESQFHMVYDNHVMGLMSAGSARLFANFIHENLPEDAA